MGIDYIGPNPIAINRIEVRTDTDDLFSLILSS